jgi:SAM-dependent methyltransferase
VKPGPEELEIQAGTAWPGWCCSYCAAPLEPRPFGLMCAAEGRFFSTHGGVQRLLSEERRREIRPFLELYQRVRRDEGWRVEPGLPEVPPGHPHAGIWRARAQRFGEGLELAAQRLGPGRWRVLEVGAGCCWAAVRLLERGHRVAAIDLNLDADDGLAAADRLLADPTDLPRAEADMEALPLEPGAFDLVLAAGTLHYTNAPSRTLVELRRVTRRGGLLLVLDSPVYRRRRDGEAMVAERMRAHSERYRVPIPRESQSGYFVHGELRGLFEAAGWSLEMHGWPRGLREWARDMLELARYKRRTARFPILVGRRHG